MRKLRILLPVLVVLIIGFAGFSNYRHIRHKREMQRSIEDLPAFSFIRQDGGSFDNSGIDPAAERVLINYFNPECEHCQYMAGEFVKNAGKFEKDQLLFLTTADSLSVEKFRKTYGLDRLPGLVLLRDTKYRFAGTFGVRILPSFFIYGRDGKLIRKIAGETKIDHLEK